MKKSKPSNRSQKLTSEVQLARIRVAKAESDLNAARERSRAAKRRRKDARQAARRAKKQVRLAKANLSEAIEALTEAKTKLRRAAELEAKKSVKRPTRKKPAAKVNATRKKKASRPSSVRSASSILRRSSGRATGRKSVSRTPKPSSSRPRMVAERASNGMGGFEGTPNINGPLATSETAIVPPQTQLPSS